MAASQGMVGEPAAARRGMGSGPLAGRVALVTGASRGIGRGIALALAEAGADVLLTYRRNGDAAAAAARTVEEMGRRALAVEASMADAEAVEQLAAAAEEFGPVDLLVSNAGAASSGRSIADTEPAEFERLLATHVLGLQRLLARLLPAMRGRSRSDVVVISSSEVTYMRAGGAPYNLAKAALEALALTLAHEEAANGVHVNIVAPGLVVTDMGDKLVRAKLGLESAADLDAGQPFGRVCRPADIGAAVAFLCSAQSAMVSGQRIVVDGGADASPSGAGGPAR